MTIMHVDGTRALTSTRRPAGTSTSKCLVRTTVWASTRHTGNYATRCVVRWICPDLAAEMLQDREGHLLHQLGKCLGVSPTAGAMTHAGWCIAATSCSPARGTSGASQTT